MLLGFLLDDYKLTMPCLLWDGLEMVRKLSLSVIGAWFPSKSPVAIASALLCAALFLVLQCNYRPFRSAVCNAAQQACLAALCLLYFAGLLLKVRCVEDADREALGHLLCLVLFLVLVAVAGAMLMQVAAMARNLARARRCGRVLRRLLQSDPPHGSDAFYLIQIADPRRGVQHGPRLPSEAAG
jgi:hypothetical protein